LCLHCVQNTTKEQEDALIPINISNFNSVCRKEEKPPYPSILKAKNKRSNSMSEMFPKGIQKVLPFQKRKSVYPVSWSRTSYEKDHEPNSFVKRLPREKPRTTFMIRDKEQVSAK